MSVVDRLIEVAQAIGKTPDVDVHYADIELLDGSTDSLWTLVTGRQEQLPAVLRDMLRIGDRLGVSWQSKSEVDGQPVLGEFFLRSPLALVSGNALPEALQERKAAGIDLRNVREFDFQPRSSGPIHALLPVEAGSITDRIFIYDEVEALPSELTCASYLEALTRTRGIFFWQYLYCDKRIEPIDVRVIASGLRFLEEAFGEDCSELRRRLEDAPKGED